MHKNNTMVWKVMAVEKVIRQSWKLSQNLCSVRWLKPNLRRIRNFRHFGLKILYMIVWTGRIKDNNLLLKTETDSEFLKLRSKLNQSFRVEGKKEYLKQSVRQFKVGILLFLVLTFVSYLEQSLLNN